MTPIEVRFSVRLTPRAGADRVDGVVDGALRVRVAAPAVDGAANHALVRLLAEELGVGRASVRLVAGATARRKLIAIEGADRSAIVARWPDLAVRWRDLAGPGGQARHVGDWLSRLERAVHIREVTGSNPVSPTTVTSTEAGSGVAALAARPLLLLPRRRPGATFVAAEPDRAEAVRADAGGQRRRWAVHDERLWPNVRLRPTIHPSAGAMTRGPDACRQDRVERLARPTRGSEGWVGAYRVERAPRPCRTRFPAPLAPTLPRRSGGTSR